MCGAEGTRTPDPLHAMEVRYQLRYSPVWVLQHIESTIVSQRGFWQ
jgi:hypothetical protein